jgi:hypothetical protein
MKRSVFIIVLIFAVFGCKKDEAQKVLTGQITFDFTPGPGDYYIILDNDQDLSNGYIARLIETSASYVSEINYVIRTDNVPAGGYYIRGGYDAESTDNMDPANPLVWEGQGWYGGGSGGSAPGAANVTNLTGNYNFIIFPLAK